VTAITFPLFAFCICILHGMRRWKHDTRRRRRHVDQLCFYVFVLWMPTTITTTTATTTITRMFGTCFQPTMRPFSERIITRHHVLNHQQQTIRRLNRFLFDPEEIDKETVTTIDDDDDNNSIIIPVVTLHKDDYRTIHAAKILGLQNGDTIRAGIVGCPGPRNDDEYDEYGDYNPGHDINDENSSNNNHSGLLTDTATVQWIPEGKVKRAEPLGNGQPPGSLRVTLHHLMPTPPGQVPTVALLLALPRPIALGRMLPMISQMGVSHLILSQATKVPKDYFGSHLFRKPEVLRDRLIEGLCQAGDVKLPKVQIVKNLKQFLENDLDEQFPVNNYARVMAHPQRPNHNDANVPKRMRDIDFPSDNNNNNNNNNNPTSGTKKSSLASSSSSSSASSPRRILLAVGPEGGWEEPNELERFQRHGFQQVTLGSRVLRSDCAVVSLLALAQDACSG